MPPEGAIVEKFHKYTIYITFFFFGYGSGSFLYYSYPYRHTPLSYNNTSLTAFLNFIQTSLETNLFFMALNPIKIY